MPYELKKVSARKYIVINTETGVEHSHATSKKKGEAQIRLLNLLHHQQGTGFFSDLSKSIKNVANKAVQGVKDLGNKALNLGEKIVNPSTAYPPELQKLKDDLGTEIITEIEIRRTPVPEVISSAMNVVSLGSFNKKMSRLPFDKLFHLFIVVKTDKGSQFLLEKNARIHATTSVPNLPNTTTMKVANIPADLNVANLIDNTQNQMGDKFLPYNPVSNNCQSFILAVLQANKLATPDLTTFIKQDTSSLFKSDPTLEKISTGLTNLGASFDVAMKGGALALEKKKKYIDKLISQYNNMSDFLYRLPQAEKQMRSALNIPMHRKEMQGEGMHGDGIDWKGIGKSIAGALNIPTDTAGAKKLAKKVISVGLPSASAALLGGVGGLAGPLTGMAGATLGGVAGRLGAEQANKAIGGSGMRKRGRPRKAEMHGNGWVSGLLDKPVSARQVIRAAKSLPGLVEEAKQDIRGGTLAGDMMDLAVHGVAGKKMPKQRGITSGVVSLPMSGKGAGRPAKGSQEAKDKMRKLREMRKK